MDELIYSSATELARVIQSKEVSSVEVVSAYLERINADLRWKLLVHTSNGLQLVVLGSGHGK